MKRAVSGCSTPLAARTSSKAWKQSSTACACFPCACRHKVSLCKASVASASWYPCWARQPAKTSLRSGLLFRKLALLLHGLCPRFGACQRFRVCSSCSPALEVYHSTCDIFCSYKPRHLKMKSEQSLAVTLSRSTTFCRFSASSGLPCLRREKNRAMTALCVSSCRPPRDAIRKSTRS